MSPRIYSVGDRIEGPVKTMTAERLALYAVSLASAVAGEPRPAPRNIHTDREYAQSQGWPDVIADGMITANWIETMLLATFGRDFLERGELRAKFIRPVKCGDVVHIGAEILEVSPESQGTRLSMKVWCAVDETNPLTAGEASVVVFDGT